MDIEIAQTKKVLVLGLDKRIPENLIWCAITYGTNRLYWVDNYLICLEVYEKSFDHEIKRREFPISQICYANFPKYIKTYEVEKGVQIPIVNASDMRIFNSLMKAILKSEENNART